MLNRLAQKSSPENRSALALRIQPELNLEYPQADIVDIDHDEAAGQYRITTTFFGLYGVSSPLPGFYTEELLDDEWDELSGRKEFFDVIHNHIYPLLYRAWLKYKYSHMAVEFNDARYMEIIFSLIGLGEAYRDEGEDYGYLLGYSGLLSQRTRSLVGLKTILRDHFGDLGIDIRPCVERKVPITRNQQCLLGRQNTSLSRDAVIGKQVDDRNGRFSVEIGPLNAARFAEITRKRETVDWIRKLIKLYLVQPLDYGITLLLEPGAETPASLGDVSCSVLGGNCWLISSTNREVERIDLMEYQS